MAQPLVNLTLRAENTAERAKSGRLDQEALSDSQPEVKVRPGKGDQSAHQLTIGSLSTLAKHLIPLPVRCNNWLPALMRVSEQRTYELSKRTEYMQAAAELARILSNKP